MFEAILFFALGFFVARLTQAKIQPDMLLYWNKDCLGWRSVASKEDIRPDVRYVAAIEIEPTQFNVESE